MKRVSFDEDKNTTYVVDAYDECRMRYWENIAIDRMRFDRRIKSVKKIIEPVLNFKHRLNVFSNNK